jgi:hypothetical protein
MGHPAQRERPLPGHRSGVSGRRIWCTSAIQSNSRNGPLIPQMGTHRHGRQKCKFGQDLRFPLQLFLAPPLRHRLRRRAVKLQSLGAAHTLRLSFRAPPRFPIRTVRKPPAAVTLATINMSTTDERRATSISSASAKASSRCRISWPRFSASSVTVRISLCPLL